MTGPEEEILEFTWLLYGVVAGSALFRLDLPIDLRTWMILFAFFLLAVDWAEFHLLKSEVPPTTREKLSQFGLDTLILVSWVFFTVPGVTVRSYVLVFVVFLVAKTLWNIVLLSDERGSPREFQDWWIAAALLGIYWIIGTYTLASTTAFALAVLVYVLPKTYDWKRLYDETLIEG